MDKRALSAIPRPALTDKNMDMQLQGSNICYLATVSRQEIRKDGLYHKKIAIWNDTDRVKHNRTVRCPYCNSFLMCKSEGMGRQNLFAIQWSVLVQKYEDEVPVRYFCHAKDFRIDFCNPQIESRERRDEMIDKARHKIGNLLLKLNDEDRNTLCCLLIKAGYAARIGKERSGSKGKTIYFVEFWEEDADA